MIIKNKTQEQSRIYNELFDIVESKGAYEARKVADKMENDNVLPSHVLDSLLEELAMCFEIE